MVVVWGGLAAVGDEEERRRYRGTVDGVGGEARTRKINGSPRAVAEIDGVEVGRGGGVIIYGQLTWRNPVRVASPHRINLEEPGQGGQPT